MTCTRTLLIASILCLPLFSSCLYKMPEEDTVCLKPTTNNPNMAPQKGGGWMPGVAY